MGSAVDFVILTVSPEIEANLDSKVNKLGREIWGWVKKEHDFICIHAEFRGDRCQWVSRYVWVLLDSDC